MTEHSKIADEFQKVGKEGFEAAARSYGDANKGFQAIVAEATNYSKKSFEEGTRAFQAAPRRKVCRASSRNPVSVRQEGLRGPHCPDDEAR